MTKVDDVDYIQVAKGNITYSWRYEIKTSKTTRYFFCNQHFYKQQHPEVELLLFKTYLISSSTL